MTPATSSRCMSTAFEYWAIRKSALSITHAIPSPVTPSSRRGKTHNVAHLPIRTPFAPNPRNLFVLTSAPILDLFVCLLSRAGVSIASTLSKAISLVDLLKQTCHISRINAVVNPLGTRLNRGIAQLSTLPSAFAPEITTCRRSFGYICPILLLLGLFVGLVMVAGVSVKIATLLCSAGLMLVVVGNAWTIRGGEKISTRPVGRCPLRLKTSKVGLFAALLGF